MSSSSDQSNEFLVALQSKFPHFLQILADNDVDSLLAVPPVGFFTSRKLTVDEVVISEHILQVSGFDGKTVTSLAGKAYIFPSENKL
mgnify:CR=1 FL=1